MDWIPHQLPLSRELLREQDKDRNTNSGEVGRERQNSPFETIARVVKPPRQASRAGRIQPLERPPSTPKEVALSPIPERSPSRKQDGEPARPPRNLEPANVIGLQVRPEERTLLLEVGKYRIVRLSDLARQIYGGREPQLRRDLAFLQQKKLVEVHALSVRRDGRSVNIRKFEAVTLTHAGKCLLEKSGEVPEGQKIYAGLVKPREAEHDSQIYAAAVKEIARLEKSGATVRRAQLDFELKAQVHRAVYRAKKSHPDTDPAQIKVDIAQQYQLPLSDGQIVIPDARLEYEMSGGGAAHLDIEVVTAAYRHGHIAQKVQAGFKLYMSHGDFGRLGAAIQDDHDLMSEILDL